MHLENIWPIPLTLEETSLYYIKHVSFTIQFWAPKNPSFLFVASSEKTGSDPSH